MLSEETLLRTLEARFPPPNPNPNPNHLHPAAGYLLPTTLHLLPTTYYLPPTTCQARFRQGRIYTDNGPMLIAVNPFRMPRRARAPD